MTSMNISQTGVNLIKGFEGLSLKAYKPVPTEKYLTIGYGHYGSEIKPGQTITAAQAESMLRNDLQRYVAGVNGCLKVSVNQNQFDALCSFAYNLGVGALQGSDMLKLINQSKFTEASKQFGLWVHAGGRVLQGLVIRRGKEASLFNTPVSKPVAKPVVKPVVKPAVKPAVKPVVVAKPVTYKVIKGDTLSKIAVKYSTTVVSLKTRNKLKSDLIQIGQVLVVK